MYSIAKFDPFTMRPWHHPTDPPQVIVYCFGAVFGRRVIPFSGAQVVDRVILFSVIVMIALSVSYLQTVTQSPLALAGITIAIPELR